MSPTIADRPVQWVCTTPTKNESWIIGPFAAAAKTWANHVIVADQLSTDGTREQLRQTPGVDLVLNDSTTFDENHRQQLLLSRARMIEGQRVLIGLDADEAFSANARSTSDWQKIVSAKPGTILRFRWVNILPGFKHAWIPPGHTPFGFVDDGSTHTGKKIHSPRVPYPENAPILDLNEIVVLHFQYVLWDRMLSKQRWYQAWEHIKHREKGALDIFRQYNHMVTGWKKQEIHPIRPEWLSRYEQAGINFKALVSEPVTWWDREVLQMLSNSGTKEFRRISVWNKDWTALGRQLGLSENDLSDPRTAWEKLAHRLLAASQNHRSAFFVRSFEQLLRRTGW